MPTGSGDDDFRGERFSIVRLLGAGGMGKVYEAIDEKRGTRVAMKTLNNLNAGALFRFKKEFRALADLAHPNLVTLYELFSSGEEWFFTMELVEGAHLLDYVRDRPREFGEQARPDEDATLPTDPLRPARSRVGRTRDLPEASVVAPADPERLGAALLQLVDGLGALHATGRLHCDIKPSNILVTAAGRVVICDFGVVTDLTEGWPEVGPDQVVGTAAYMSPEQAAGLPLGPATDWYSVGVVLYQALCGRRPFRGSARQVLREKQLREPVPPSSFCRGVPEHLERLCLEMLRIEPAARPTADRIVLALHGRDEPPAPRDLSRASCFVGRAAQLARLSEALHRVRGGQRVTVCVHGSSGMGKTTLVKHFLEAAAADDALVLSGRCFERESVPYKALDNLMDSLSSYLRRLPREVVQALLPPDVHELVRVFPVLGRVEAIADAPTRPIEIPDPLESRRRASAAMRELLRRLGQRRALVILLDDLQWGDVDSAALIAELLRPPDAPVLLLIASYRSEDANTSPFLKMLLRRDRGGALSEDLRLLPVDALTLDEARSLTEALVDPAEPGAGDVETIARESGGSPLFVHALVRHAQLRGAPVGAGRVALDDVLAALLHDLDDGPRGLLTVVSVAGRPLPQTVAFQAAGLGAEGHQALALLRVERLVRSCAVGEREELETFHDRIREVAVAALDGDQLRRCHRRLVVALQARGDADPEALVAHLLGAGERERAGRQAERAADQAAASLAFDRAAELYRLARELSMPEPAPASRLRTRQGDALVNAGRGAEAAEVYRLAIDGATKTEALELRRRVAEQLLRSGHLDEGVAVIHDVLELVGLRLARTPGRALVSLLVGRARLRLRGVGYAERDPSEIPGETLARIDICWSVATALGVIDFMRGADFQTRHLRLALSAGEPYRIARGLAIELAYSGTQGGPRRKRTDRLARDMEAIAGTTRNPHVLGLSATCAGMAAFFIGRWREAYELCTRGEVVYRERCTGVAWELASTRFFALGALFYLGEIGQLVRRVPSQLAEAEARGDLYAATGLRSWRTNIVWLANDDPDEAAREVEEAARRWTRQGFHLQHYYELLATTQIDLYRGDGAAAMARLATSWPALERSRVQHVQNVRIESLYLRARSALAAGDLAPAARDARLIARERMPWSDPLARLLEAQLAARRSDPEAAVAHLRDAVAGFDGASMGLHAAAARQRLGALLGGDEGAALISGATAWMTGQQIRDPSRMTQMLAP